MPYADFFQNNFITREIFFRRNQGNVIPTRLEKVAFIENRFTSILRKSNLFRIIIKSHLNADNIYSLNKDDAYPTNENVFHEVTKTYGRLCLLMFMFFKG